MKSAETRDNVAFLAKFHFDTAEKEPCEDEILTIIIFKLGDVYELVMSTISANIGGFSAG